MPVFRSRAALTFFLTTAVTPLAAQAARLPWPAQQRVWVTQDCNDERFDDHVGANGHAWDFAAEVPFTVTARPRPTAAPGLLVASPASGLVPRARTAARNAHS